MIVSIYVPRKGSSAAQSVLPGSALVGDPSRMRDGAVLCYFEGNKNLADNIKTFADKLIHAAGRLARDYPTVAKGAFRAEELIEVGRYDAVRCCVVEVSDGKALSGWAGDTLETITGVQLPLGPIEWNKAAEATKDGGKFLARLRGGTTLVYRSRAGQVLEFDSVQKTVAVRSHDDPAVAEMLEGWIQDALKPYVFGSSKDEGSSPSP